MIHIRQFILRLGSVRRRFLSAYYLQRFRVLEGVLLARLRIGRGVHFWVPVRSDGAGTLVIGSDNSFGYSQAVVLGDGGILLQPRRPEAKIILGDGNRFSNNVTICANEQIVLGDGCLIGDQVAIYDSDFHEISPVARKNGPGPSRPVRIGNNVWLGSRTMVLKGVMIGDNSVIGAMSLVTRSIPANCVAAGIPAKLIRRLG